MTIALVLLGVACLFELPLWLLKNNVIRNLLAFMGILLILVGSVVLIASQPAIWSLLVIIVSCYRLVNLARVIKRHIQADYLFHAVRRSSMWLIVAQIVIVGVVFSGRHFHVSSLRYEYTLAAVQLLMVLVLLASLRRHWYTSKPPVVTKAYVERDLPTLTIAIPARNETDELEECLNSLVKSTYPKLEVLVLDDCSQNRRTPEIIRSFAHDGVRFVSGSVPPENWLAKNFAYEQLANEANGELILFCGVDMRFSADSLSVIVETMLQKEKTMMSWLPMNQAPPAVELESMFVQPSRYGWELALPRRAFQRPPVLSSCWIINSENLRASGGFKATAHSISPESYFAHQAIKNNDGYSFLWADQAVGLTCTKTLSEQRDTAIRTRYPQLHRRLELVAGLSLIEFALFVLPFISLIVSLSNQTWAVALLSGIVCICLSIFYASLIKLTYRQFLIRGLWLVPFAALYDIVLLNYSLNKYEFGEVLWKGRNVCIPVMRVIPKLPSIS